MKDPITKDGHWNGYIDMNEVMRQLRWMREDKPMTNEQIAELSERQPEETDSAEDLE